MKLIKETVKGIARRLGIHLTRIPRGDRFSQSIEYEVVVPAATYSPWNIDDEFNDIYSLIKELTLVDKYRCFELWKLVEQVAKLESGSIIEIGVWRGGTGALIATQALRCGINAKVYLCDTFNGVVKAGPNDSSYKGGEHSDTNLDSVDLFIHKTMSLHNVEILEGIFPDYTGHKVEEETFRYCHIDVDVYQSAKDILEWIWERIVTGGLIIFDDYGFYGCDGIAKLVNEQAKLKDRLVITNLNGHAIILKL